MVLTNYRYMKTVEMILVLVILICAVGMALFALFLWDVDLYVKSICVIIAWMAFKLTKEVKNEAN